MWGKPYIKVFAQIQKKQLTFATFRRHVLTAAHCMSSRDIGNVEENPSLLTVVLGMHKREWVKQLAILSLFSFSLFQ